MNDYLEGVKNFYDGTRIVGTAAFARVAYALTPGAKVDENIAGRIKAGFYIGFGRMIGSKRLDEKGQMMVAEKNHLEKGLFFNSTLWKQERNMQKRQEQN